jgi:hypothetical protein
MYDAQGSKLYHSEGSPASLAQVLKIRRISDPAFTRNWKERTDLDSAAEEGKPGIPRIGEMSIEVFWHPDDSGQHAALLNAWKVNSQREFKIVWPDTALSFVSFQGFVMGFTGVEEVDGDLVRTFTLRGTGMPNFGTGG